MDLFLQNSPMQESFKYIDVMPFDGGGRAYTYKVPAEKNVCIGMLVHIPLGARRALGIVWREDVLPAEEWTKKIRSIIEICYDIPVLSPDAIHLCEWISNYYAAPLNTVLLTLLPAAVRRGVRPILEKSIVLARHLQAEELAKLKHRAKKQAELYEILCETKSPILRNSLNFSPAIINALLLAGIAREEVKTLSREAYADEHSRRVSPIKFSLSEEQLSALNSIATSLDKKKYQTHLLHGVTGSGKTEVYIGAIQKVLNEGGSAIFLVPEVALTPQTVERLRSRLSDCGTQIVVWHSHLSSGERFDAWMNMARGNARVLVGARSAIFAPLQNLRLIIVDEEHEPSFKQGETPFYHGRDVAVFRAHLLNAVCVLGSATPSLESFYNASIGKYTLNKILKRPEGRSFPPMKIIDMRREILHAKGQSSISRTLLEALKHRLEVKEQSILFLNRRGYSRALICPDCGHVITCPHCSSALTYHRENQILRCHLCDYTESAASTCPSCNSKNIRKKGYGTQRAEEILQLQFPSAKIVRLDADTMSKKNEFRKILNAFRDGEIDILLGTQMIAKGLDFPRVTLVGILDADLSLHIPDFRAAERTFQLLVQVAGRAGRGQLEGEVLVQSFTPFAPPIQFAKREEFDEFLEDELARREEFGYPPKRHIIRHIFRGANSEEVAQTASDWIDFLEKQLPGLFEIRGPAPCPLEKIQDNFRYHAWYFCEKIPPIIRQISQIRAQFPWRESVIDILDVDPVELS